MTEIYAEVTFFVKEGTEDALKAKAREIDAAEDTEVPEEYTVAQALQVVWHAEPQWLHDNVLEGWTLDKCVDESGSMRLVWP